MRRRRRRDGPRGATFDCERAGFSELTTWAEAVAPGATIGIEGSASYGAPVAHYLMAAGLIVREVPPQLSRRERGRSRRAGKSDPGDALAIARVTVREPDLPPVRLEDRTTELGLLADARDDLVHAQTRARNRLHPTSSCSSPVTAGRPASSLAAVSSR